MRYAEFPAPPELSTWVRCLWSFEASFDPFHDERIVPDGCPEIIVHFGNPYLERDESGDWLPQPSVLLAGNLTRPLHLRAVGQAGVLGIRLWPQAARHWVAMPAEQIPDRRFALELPDAARVCQRIARSDDASRLKEAGELLAALTTNPLRARRGHHKPDADRTAETVKRIFTCRGQVDPAVLADEAGLSQRQLERRFKTECGMSLKKLSSLVRFRHVFDELQADVPSPWLNAALASGYFDQAHMIRDFRRFAGQPPSAFLPRAGALSTAILKTPA